MISTSDAIVPIDSPEAQLAKVGAIREVVLGQSDLPGTYREYAKLTGLEESLKQYKGQSDAALFEITLIRREAERKMGQMLLEIPRHPGARTDLTTSSAHPMRLYGQILQDLGIKQDRAHDWQLAAQCPEEEFRKLVEYGRAGIPLVNWDTGDTIRVIRPIALKHVVQLGTEQKKRAEQAAQKEAEEEARRKRKAEILPKVKILTESISQLPVLEERLAELNIEELDPRTKREIDRIIKRNYAEEINQREQERRVSWRESQREQDELQRKISQLREMQTAVVHLAQWHREGASFHTLAAAIKPLLGKRHPNRPRLDGMVRFEIARAIDFTAEDVRAAIAYLEEVAKELESIKT
jgi:hypothetical protein